MDYNRHASSINQSHVEMLTKSLERLSIYDGHGKVRILQVSPKTDFLNVIGDLDLAGIQERMYAKQ